MSERARRAAAAGSMENAVGGVVRVTLQFPDDDGVGDGVVVGHLGLVKEEDPRDGLRVELLTAPSAEEHWLTDDLRAAIAVSRAQTVSSLESP